MDKIKFNNERTQYLFESIAGIVETPAINELSAQSKYERRHTDKNYEGTLGKALLDMKDELSQATTSPELTDILKRCKENGAPTNYTDEIINKVKRLPFEKAYQMLYNIILKGSGMSTEYLEERELQDDEPEVSAFDKLIDVLTTTGEFEIEDSDDNVVWIIHVPSGTSFKVSTNNAE